MLQCVSATLPDFHLSEIRLSKLELIRADGGYAGDKLQGWMQTRFGARPLCMEIDRRSDPQKGFAVLSRRWVVEHTFGWLHQSSA